MRTCFLGRVRVEELSWAMAGVDALPASASSVV